jgi:hypothetical protein
MEQREVPNGTFQQAQIHQVEVENTALQLYQYPLPGLSRKAKAALLEELKVLTALINGHIARVYKVYWTTSTLNILQETVPCDSLSQVLPT